MDVYLLLWKERGACMIKLVSIAHLKTAARQSLKG